MTKPDFLESLNLNQRAAAEHGSGPLLVIAGAGSGKTRTLVARLARLILSGVDPGRILLLTFTRRAANEMIRRAGQLVGEGVASLAWGGTFHSVAHHLLRLHGPELGLANNFMVLDQGDAQDLLDLVRTDLQLHCSRTAFPKKNTLLAIYSRCVNTNESLDQVVAKEYLWCQPHLPAIKKIFEAYGERKAARNLLDFDDLLLHWDAALDQQSIRESIVGRFQHILVDEYQDTNPLQASILLKTWKHMNATGRRGDQCSIMAVGDDAQAIYSFRGATVDNILRFPEQYPGTTQVTLDQNYRSVMPILQAANAVMSPARQGFKKELWSTRASTQQPFLVTCADEIAQARYVADRILELREEGVTLAKQAVLFRAGHNSNALEIELGRRGIPFVKWGGLKFLEAAHIKDMLAFLRIAENLQDELSWMRVLQLIDGIGPGRAREAVLHIQSQRNHKSLLTWSAPVTARKALGELVQLLDALTSVETEMLLPTQIERVRHYYTPFLQERYENAEMRLRDLDQLELLAVQAKTRRSFLADITLDPPASTRDLAKPTDDEDEDPIVLSTIHSAKGCEWDAVYLIQALDGALPSAKAQEDCEIEEERRLLYVAMTRARNRLYVTFPLRCYSRGQPMTDSYGVSQLTRFLPPDLFAFFDRQSYSPLQPEVVPSSPCGQATSLSVTSRVKALWDFSKRR